jgi:hypothetical protein
MQRTRWYLGSILAAAVLVPLRLPADENAAATVDSDFLEFLGSLDSDDVAWIAYLTSVDATQTTTPKPTKPADKAVPEGESK